MGEARKLLEGFAAGDIDALQFQAAYLSVWREMRDRHGRWAGADGMLLASIFGPAECFDPDLSADDPRDPFTLNEAAFRSEVLEIHRKLHAPERVA